MADLHFLHSRPSDGSRTRIALLLTTLETSHPSEAFIQNEVREIRRLMRTEAASANQEIINAIADAGNALRRFAHDDGTADDVADAGRALCELAYLIAETVVTPAKIGKPR